jgi:hypothetical protein
VWLWDCGEQIGCLSCLVLCKRFGIILSAPLIDKGRDQASRIENNGAVRPQAWRHIVEAFTEEFVTGSSDWPACGDADCVGGSLAYEWDQSPELRVPSVEEYRGCAREILATCFPRPWRHQDVPVSRVIVAARASIRCFASPPFEFPPSVGVEEPMAQVDADVEEPTAQEDTALESFLNLVLQRMEAEGHIARRGDIFCAAESKVPSFWAWKLLDGVRGDVVFSEAFAIGKFLPLNFGDLEGDDLALATRWGVALLDHLASVGIVEAAALDDGLSANVPSERSWRRLRWWIQDVPGEVGLRVHESPVQLNALGPVPENVDAMPASRRCVRSREPCAVCARFGWERDLVHMWKQPGGSVQHSIICDGARTHRHQTRDDGYFNGEAEEAGGGLHHDALDARMLVSELLSPVSYCKRWSFMDRDERRLGPSSLSACLHHGGNSVEGQPAAWSEHDWAIWSLVVP